MSLLTTPLTEQLGIEVPIYSLQSLWRLKRSAVRSFSYKDYLQAGKSVEGIESILPVAEVVRRFRKAGEAGDLKTGSAGAG